MNSRRRSYSRNFKRSISEAEIVEIEKAREELRVLRRKNKIFWVEFTQKVILGMVTVVVAILGYVYSEPFFERARIKYEQKLDSLIVEIKEVSEIKDLTKNQYDSLVIENRNLEIRSGLVSQLLRIRIDSLTQRIRAISSNSEGEVEYIQNILISEIDELELMSKNTPNELNYRRPIRNSELIYDPNFKEWRSQNPLLVSSKYILNHPNLFWFKLHDDPNLYSPQDGEVTNVTDASLGLPILEVKMNDHIIQFWGIDQSHLPIGSKVISGQSVGVASADYNGVRAIGIQILDKNQKVLNNWMNNVIPID
jgi:hypothetical protein